MRPRFTLGMQTHVVHASTRATLANTSELNQNRRSTGMFCEKDSIMFHHVSLQTKLRNTAKMEECLLVYAILPFL